MDLLTHKTGYVINSPFQDFHPIPRAAHKGEEIFETLEAAKEAFLKKFEKERMKSLTSGYYNNSLSSLNKRHYFLEVNLPNCWMYDTEPIEDGTRYALKILVMAEPLLVFHEYKGEFEEFKE
jgi:hypothetical protein